MASGSAKALSMLAFDEGRLSRRWNDSVGVPTAGGMHQWNHRL
jgi:hypothetical protein